MKYLILFCMLSTVMGEFILFPRYKNSINNSEIFRHYEESFNIANLNLTLSIEDTLSMRFTKYEKGWVCLCCTHDTQHPLPFQYVEDIFLQTPPVAGWLFSVKPNEMYHAWTNDILTPHDIGPNDKHFVQMDPSDSSTRIDLKDIFKHTDIFNHTDKVSLVTGNECSNGTSMLVPDPMVTKEEAIELISYLNSLV